jgi:hypothetical protein
MLMGRTVSPRLSAAIQRVQQWRALHGGSGRGSRIPEELWNEAVEVARAEGVWATARALHFQYERLKERMVNAPRAGRQSGGGDGKTTAFVELGMAELSGGGKAVVELVSRHGDRMRVEVPGAGLDLTGLVQTFWSRRCCN